METITIMSRPAWKAALSEAVVTGGEALGEVVPIQLPGRQYLVTLLHLS